MRPARLALLACAAGCGGSNDSATPSRHGEAARPNVLLVVIDTLRADRLPFHGCARNNAPFLGELAEQGLVFENAWSPAPWTVPATASILTSVHPFQHGVVDLFDLGAEEEELAESTVNRLPDDLQTLPELFEAHGYRTFGVSANVLVGFEMGFDRGFDRFVSLHDMDAATVNATLAEWLDEIQDPAASEPWFVYLHYFDPHDNYHRRAPWFDVDGLEEPDEESASRFARFRGQIRREEEEDLEYAEELAAWSLHFVERTEDEEFPDEPPRAAIDRLLAAYDSEIRYLDEHLREMLAALDPGGDAAVLITADHGEEFLDHGDMGHGQSVHDELVHVPLIVLLPGPDRPTGRTAANVSTLDVVPTCRELIGAPTSALDQGASLLGELRADRIVYSMRLEWPMPDAGEHARREEEFAVIQGADKLIFSDADNRSTYRLYDREQDPAETESLAGRRPARVLKLREVLDRLLAELPRWERTFGSAVVDEAIRAHVRGIGYAGDDE